MKQQKPQSPKQFILFLQKFYKENKRDSLPWRHTTDLYHILVSEIMLQQTQVSRVLIKYTEFLQKFPTVETLASSSLRNVLTVWQGLGYNRRAKFLHLAAIALRAVSVQERGDEIFLKSLPGVGQSTLGAIIAFTQNKPVVFIETNIRAVILYHFFKDEYVDNKKDKIDDREITKVLENIVQMLPEDFGPRDFYYALYDYGSFLKQKLGKDKKILHEKSKSYTKQSKFSGSRRQLRAFVLRVFLKMGDGFDMERLCIEVMKTKTKELEKYKKEDALETIEQLKVEGMLR